MQRVLVTGSSGLIGSEAVESYDRRGYEVHGVDNNMRREFFYATPAEARDELLKLAGDLLKFEDLPEALEYHQSLHESTSG